MSFTPLVSTAWLGEHLHDEDLVVCDCRFAGDRATSRRVYETGHVPGAIHVFWLDDLSAPDTTVTTFVPDADRAGARLSALGIGDDSVVVACADNANLYASRLWHVLTLYGHDTVALLDGGIEKWAAEGRPLERGAVTRAAAPFHPRPSGRDRTIGGWEILARLRDPRLRLVDVRDEDEYTGERCRAARGGHIPGALLLPWHGNLRPDGTLRDALEIRAIAARAGLRPDQEIVTYCQGGVRAAHTALALGLAGFPRVRVYDGSWAEWGNHPDLPVVAGGQDGAAAPCAARANA
jgi:thiosulfate/3-mercaptopyruvate sulfurtransferase